MIAIKVSLLDCLLVLWIVRLRTCNGLSGHLCCTQENYSGFGKSCMYHTTGLTGLSAIDISQQASFAAPDYGSRELFSIWCSLRKQFLHWIINLFSES